MTVHRDFELVYRTQEDPWGIGDASSDRYNAYVELASPYASGDILDIGCGMGALLARFRGQANILTGIELSPIAVEKGRSRFPFINFELGNAEKLQNVQSIHGKKFDFIICSDVVCYLRDNYKVDLVAWIDEHLKTDGKALIAGWCPGGKYPTQDELALLTTERLKLLTRKVFDSGHLALLVAKRRRLASLTIDYETWHPIPEGKRIDWVANIFRPAEQLLGLLKSTGTVATFFAEMGEYFWLQANDPDVARRMEQQWRQVVSQGHDVQLHLHPSWLPETGATFVDGQWTWDWSKAKAEDYPGDLTALIRRCKAALETAIRPVSPGYAATCFRAGAYQAQPFERLSRALIENGILCDSSVYPHGRNEERGYDYTHAYTRHQPYFADLLDPQLKAVPAEERIVELPIFTPEPGRRWFMDGAEGERLTERLRAYEGRHRRAFSTLRIRAHDKAQKIARALYGLTGSRRGMLNRFIPRSLSNFLVAHDYGRPLALGDAYYVAIGHTKAELRMVALERELISLKRELGVEFVTLSEMASLARRELEDRRRTNALEEIAYQVARETPVVLTASRDSPQSFHLQDMIPLDVKHILDLGCGSGRWSARIATLLPWVDVVGVDAGEKFIAKAQREYAEPRVRFEVQDFARLRFPDGAFDCVYADNTLEHCFDLEGTLREVHRVLRDGGCLVAAVPPDGLNPDQDCDNHTWKTIAPQLARRLERVGFCNITINEADTFRLGMPPFRPSSDRMLYARAWKMTGGEDRLQRAIRAMNWLYRRIDPTKSNSSEDGKQIISDGHAYCLGYAVALGELLKREGYDVTWITMLAEGHQSGSGPHRRDSHEVIEVAIAGERHVLDPTTNTVFACSLDELICDPSLADRTTNGDERCRERGYHLYNSSYWYERVAWISRRRNIRFPSILWRKAGR